MPRFPFIGTGERLARHLAAVLEVAPPGHHVVVTVAAGDTTALQPTRELLARYYPTTTINRQPVGFESVFDTDRARNLLGFVPVRDWRTP